MVYQEESRFGMSDKTDFDVVVIGAGASGCVAAIQAARAGAETLLLEKNGILGGTTTVGSVNYPGLFHAWGRQVIAGIGWELVERTVAEAGGELPNFSDYDMPHPGHHVAVDRFLYTSLVEQAYLDAGGFLQLHAMPAELNRTDRGWQIGVCTKSGLSQVRASVLVDCTGDADAAAMAGFEREQNQELQPASPIFTAGGYDLDAIDSDKLQQALEQAIASGELKATDFHSFKPDAKRFLTMRRYGQVELGKNYVHLPAVDGGTSAGKTQADVRGRQALLRVYRFLRRQPGLESFHYTYVAPETGIRETYTIKGESCVTFEDYWTGRLWDDAVCYSFYPIDVHRSSGDGIDIRRLSYGTLPTLPRGAMLPVGSSRFLVPGRAICSDKEANSACRVQASAMATGQAAGAMAALSADRDKEPRELPIADVLGLLREHGAIILGDVKID